MSDSLARGAGGRFLVHAVEYDGYPDAAPTRSLGKRGRDVDSGDGWVCGRGQRSDAVTRTGYATGALGCLCKVRDEHAHLEDLARHHGHLDEVHDPPPGDAEREEAVNVVLLRAQGVSGWVGGREVGPARESGRAWAGMADARTGGREGRGGERTKLAQQIEKVRASTVKLVPKGTSSLHFQSSLLPGDVRWWRRAWVTI